MQKVGDLVTDPAVVANGYLAPHPHRHYGDVPTLRSPVDLLGTPARVTRDAPELGEHSAELLRERLDLNDAEIADLAASGVIA